MDTVLVLKLSLVFLFIRSCAATSNTNSSKVAIVELLIVFDHDFALQFDNDDQQLRRFWYNQMWEVNTRFKSLVKSNVDVRMVDLVVLEENHYLQYSSRKSTRSFFTELSSWLYKRNSILEKFDMALFVAGVMSKLHTNVWVSSGGICQVDPKLKRNRNFAVIVSHSQNHHFSMLVAQGLGETLGSPVPDCKLMLRCHNQLNYLRGGPYDKGRFFYSGCADDAIAAHLERKTSQCVFHNDAEALDDTEVSKNYPLAASPSLNDQCRKESSISTAFADEAEFPCVTARCQYFALSLGFSSFGRTVVGRIVPVDNSPCSANSNCFRGVCLLRGYQIVNVNVGRCIRSENRFSSKDEIVLATCRQRSTPLETLRIEEGKFMRKRLITSYSKPHGTETLSKCLLVNAQTMTVEFRDWAASPDEYWHFLRVDKKDFAFMLFHISTRTCVSVYRNASVVATVYCNSDSLQYLWSFDDPKMVSKFFLAKMEKHNGTVESSFGSWIRNIFYW